MEQFWKTQDHVSSEVIEGEELALPVEGQPIAPNQKQIAVAVFKADAMRAGLADLDHWETGLEVLHRQEQLLANEEAAELYNQHVRAQII